jgi:acyl carrier protein
MSETVASRGTFEQRVLEALAEVVPESASASLVAGQAFRDQIDMDSVDYLNFVLALEARCGLEVSELDYPKLASLRGAVDYLLERAAAGAPV